MIDTEEYQIMFNDIGAKDTVVAFSGIALQFLGIPQAEFVQTLRNMGESFNTCFVVDKTLTWYGKPYENLRKFLETLSGENILFMGNSMGGVASIMFSGVMPYHANALAFSPQYEPNGRQWPHDHRWDRMVNEYTPISVTHGAVRRATGIVLSGADDPYDPLHAQLIVDNTDMIHYAVPNAAHNVPQAIRDRGLLSEVVRLALYNQHDQIEGILQ